MGEWICRVWVDGLSMPSVTTHVYEGWSWGKEKWEGVKGSVR